MDLKPLTVILSIIKTSSSLYQIRPPLHDTQTNFTMSMHNTDYCPREPVALSSASVFSVTSVEFAQM